MTEILGPIPGEYVEIAMNQHTQRYWEGAREDKLVLPACGHCGHYRMPPTPFCPKCQSETVDWREQSGEGVIYTFAICRRSPFPGTAGQMTYAAAIVEIPDTNGSKIVTNIVGVPPEDVAIGQKVHVAFNPIQGGWKVPVFVPNER